MLGGLARSLYIGIREDFFGYFLLGVATAICIFFLKLVGIGGTHFQFSMFLEELSKNLSDLSPHILLAAILVVCVAVAFRGTWKTPRLLEKYLLHPLLALASDTAASAVGFFLSSIGFSLFPSYGMDVKTAISSFLYYLLGATIFWVGRALAFEHGNSKIWGTRGNPQRNNFPMVLKIAGYGGLICSLLVIFLF